MKRVFVLLGIFTALVSCSNTDKPASVNNKGVAAGDSTTVQIIDTTFNFGTITEGDKVEYSFRFKNIGKKPLQIFRADASCGCTVPDKPEKPVLPGEMGYLHVVFNSAHKTGIQEKSVTVHSNANPEFPLLYLKGMVNPKPGSD